MRALRSEDLGTRLGRTCFRLFSASLCVLLRAGPLAAISPVHHYHDLVAGRGDHGLRDGPFYEALFDRPHGLAIDADGKRLFVADTGNRRIRVILLDERNRVETVAGSDRADGVDGPALQAGFQAPNALAWLPDDRLAVADGTRLRLIDLAKKTVTTVVTDPNTIDLQGIWNLLSVPAEGALYITQPTRATVRKLDLASGHISTLVEHAQELPQPAALGLLNGRVLVSDLTSGQVYQLIGDPAHDATEHRALQAVDRAEGLVGLSVSRGQPYFVRSGFNSWGHLLPLKPLRLMTAWGEFFGTPTGTKDSEGNPFFQLTASEASGFVADPIEERHFFLAAPVSNRILSLRDYHFEEFAGTGTFSSGGLADFEYPTAKPPHTVRILIASDSRSSYDAPGFGTRHNLTRMDTFPKRLELMLAMDAALDDSPVRYEVLHYNRLVTSELLVWPYYKLPNIVKSYHIDLVFLLLASDVPFRRYFESPLTAQGIPSMEPDPEYVLKPDQEKLTDPVLKRLFEAAKAKGLASVLANGHIDFAPLHDLVQHPEIRTELADLISRPYKLLNGALAGGADPAPQFYLVYAPFTEIEPVEPFELLLADIAKRDGVKVLDLANTMVALRTTFYGYNELFGNYHLNVGGHDFVAQVLARQVHQLMTRREAAATH
jgi:NHL repeat-containing protein